VRDWTHPPKLPPNPLGELPLHELVARWSEAVAAPCLCGGMILANVLDPGPGVQVHQRTEQHREWSRRVYG
jgi:hypothetical protein